MVAVQIIRLSRVSLPKFPPLGVLLAVAMLLLALPAILWKTRLRWPAEGFALVALAATAILGMWSIGFLFVPLLLVMIWICIDHLREIDNARRRRSGTAAQAGVPPTTAS